MTLSGRAKDLIIRSGHNIDPGVIEETALDSGVVQLAAAVGQIDEYAGEVPVLYVTLKGGVAAERSLAMLTEYVAAHIAEPPARPRHIFVVDQIPVTAVGKVFKPALRVDAARRRLQALLASRELWRTPT